MTTSSAAPGRWRLYLLWLALIVIAIALGQMLVVEPDEAVQRRLQIMCAVEAVRLEHLGQAPIEALDHAVGLGVFGLGQSVIDVQC